MPGITVSRLTGSGGAEIGQRITERLQASYLNTAIIREVAHRLGISEASAAEYDERTDAFIERLARVLWIADPSVVSIGGSPLGAVPAIPFAFPTEAFNGHLYVCFGVRFFKQVATYGGLVSRAIRRFKPTYRVIRDSASRERWLGATRSKEAGHVVPIDSTSNIMLLNVRSMRRRQPKTAHRPGIWNACVVNGMPS